ncbi:BRCT domain-containing protein At4g02110-like [Silene latifolia]|uniref:BRCT domain-containing protein At4g02110-like n=1 Tax=Silene latifolia TaxID=37657 RepID=UPI003D7717B5
MEYDDPRLFDGIRFFLAGFDPIKHQEVKSKIVSKGGVYVAKYPSDCTHVIVHELILDDPICVAARRDKKILVSSLWIDHSIDTGVLVDGYNIMYRPLKDLNGIPGAEELVICLTGYPRYLREDIMTMTELMGAEFSKSLMPSKITHLVCYKFEGEKYDVGKKCPTIKLVNHQWLEDCLKAWKIMPEENYTMSGYELEMMETAVHDSEDETIDTTARLTDHRVKDEIPIVQKESGRSLDNPVIASKVSIPSVQELSENVRMNEARSPEKPEQVSESRNLHSINKQSPMCQNKGDQYVRKTPVKSGHPIYVLEDLANISGTSFKRSAVSGTDQSSPMNSNIMPKTSNDNEGKSGDSKSENIKTKEHLEFDATRNSISELNGAKTTSASSGAINSKGLSEVNAEKYSPLSSRRTLRKPSLALQSEARLTIPEGRLQDDLTEKVIPAVGACTIESDKISAKDLIDAPNDKAVLPDGDGLFTIHHTKQLAGQPDDFCITPTLQKLITSSSKRIGASDPMNPLSFSRKENNNGSPISGHTGSETARVSVDRLSTEFPSVKSNVEKQQAGKSKNIDVQTSPVSGSVASSGVKTTKDKPQNIPENASFSPELKKLVASNSGNHALNSDDQTGNSISNSRRKKMVARKTLGTRPKISKKTAVDQKSSLGGNNSGVNAGLHQADQSNQNDDPNPFVTDEVVASPTVEGDIGLEAKSIQSFVYDINDCAKPSNDAKEAEVTYSPTDNTNKQKTPEAKSKGIEHGEQNLVPKKGISSLAKDIFLSAPKEVVEDECGKACEKKERVKKRTLGATGKKREGEQLVKETVSCDGPGVSNDSKSLKTLASKKRRGTLMLNKKDTPVEVGQRDAGKQPQKLSGTVISTKVLTEIANKNDCTAVNSECTDTGVEHTRKKRRGTLLLSKPQDPLSERKENVPSNNSVVGNDQGGIKGKKLAGKKRRGTLLLSKAEETTEMDKENVPVSHDHEDTSKGEALKSDLTVKDNSISSDAANNQNDSTAVKNEPAWFIVSGHRLQRKEFHQVIKGLKGKHCRDSHHWSYQATHFIVPEPIRRTEKFFAAAASGRWILKTDYLTACSQAGKFLPEEPYEWHKNGLTEDGSISLEAPRKWRLLREKTGHGAFYGMNIVVYGECIAPTLGTLKCAVKAGDGTILATCPPYTRFLKSGFDFAIVSPGITRADKWVQEFLGHEIPCVSVDYLVEYVCKPGYSLDRHVQYNTHEWAAKSFSRLSDLSTESVADAGTPESQVSDDLACQVCGFTDREDVMLVCGDESGSIGCGEGTHIDCCDPPLEEVPGEDWFCPKCTQSKTQPSESIKIKSVSKKTR